jgi:regulator of sirC expression with transglutaminase-like and TPR domain
VRAATALVPLVCLGWLACAGRPGPGAAGPVCPSGVPSLADRGLSLFAAEDPAFDAEWTRDRIDRLAAEAAMRLSGRGDPRARIEALNRYFFEELGFVADPDLENPDNLYPDRVLRRRRGYCTGLAFVYAALAERLGLPVRGVNTPQHLFLRYDDGSDRINIETLAGGREVPDDHYRRRDRIEESSVARGIFLADLDADRFLSQLANNLGTLRSRDGHPDRAAALYRRALDLDPRNPTAHYNLALEEMTAGRLSEPRAGAEQPRRLPGAARRRRRGGRRLPGGPGDRPRLRVGAAQPGAAGRRALIVPGARRASRRRASAGGGRPG